MPHKSSLANQEPTVVAVYMIELAKLEIVPRIVGFNEFNMPMMSGKTMPIVANMKKYTPSKDATDGR